MLVSLIQVPIRIPALAYLTSMAKPMQPETSPLSWLPLSARRSAYGQPCVRRYSTTADSATVPLPRARLTMMGSSHNSGVECNPHRLYLELFIEVRPRLPEPLRIKLLFNNLTGI